MQAPSRASTNSLTPSHSLSSSSLSLYSLPYSSKEEEKERRRKEKGLELGGSKRWPWRHSPCLFFVSKLLRDNNKNFGAFIWWMEKPIKHIFGVQSQCKRNILGGSKWNDMFLHLPLV